MDLSNYDMLMHHKTSLLKLTAQFSETLSHLLDTHALKQITMTQPRPPSLWMSLEISIAKRRRRYLEIVWRRTRSPLDRYRYPKQLHICNRMMSKSKSDYSANPRPMWTSVNKILHREKSKPLPDYISLDTLCSSFSKFFTDKIPLIRTNFVKNDPSRDFPEPPHVENTMNQFTHTTTSEVRSILLKSINASCYFDTFLLKHYIDDSVCNLGVVFDSDFSFHKHVSNICKSCFYHIRDLRRIRRHIPLSTAKTISNALISSRLDYCRLNPRKPELRSATKQNQ